MAAEHRSYRKKSRDVDWGAIQESERLSLEQINCGSLLRIADAAEKMAIRYAELIDQKVYWEGRAKTLYKELDRARRSNAALRGHLKRARKIGRA